MKTKLGVQTQTTAGVLKYNRLLKPTAIKGINVTDISFWEKVLKDNWECFTIHRHYPNFRWTPDPVLCAEKAVDYLQAEIGHLLEAGLIGGVEDNNEWIHSHMTSWFHDADLYMERFIQLVVEKLKVLPVVLNSGCGNFSEDIVEAFPRMLAALENFGGFIGMHEYDRGSMDRLHVSSLAEGKGGLYLCGKWKRCSSAIKVAGYEGIQFLLTEVGIDEAVQRPPEYPNLGWQKAKPAGATLSYEQARRWFLGTRNLPWFVDMLERDPDVKGALLFGCGMGGDWASFDVYPIIEEIANMIRRYNE